MIKFIKLTRKNNDYDIISVNHIVRICPNSRGGSTVYVTSCVAGASDAIDCTETPREIGDIMRGLYTGRLMEI